MKFEDFLQTVTQEDLKQVPERIAIFYFVHTTEYKSMVNDLSRISEKCIIDNEITRFRLSNDYIGNYNFGEYKLYIKSYNYSKKFAEKKIMEYLKGV